MNFVKLLEGFKDYIKGKPVLYISNAKGLSNDEIKEIRGWDFGLRFIYIASKEPMLYIFPGELLHKYVCEKLGIHYMDYWNNKQPIFFGEGKGLSHSSIIFGYSGSYELNLLEAQSKYNLGDGIHEKAKEQIKKLSNANWSLAIKCIAGISKPIELIKKIDKE